MEATKNNMTATLAPIDVVNDIRVRLTGAKFIFDEMLFMDYRDDLPKRQGLELALELILTECIDKLTNCKQEW